MEEEYDKIKQRLTETRTFLSCVCGNILNTKRDNGLTADNRVYTAQIMLDTYNALEQYNKRYKHSSTLDSLFDSCCMLNGFIENYIETLPK